LAAIPEDDFAELVNSAKQKASGAVDRAQQPKPKPKPKPKPAKKDTDDIVATCVREVEMIVRAAISGLDAEEREGLLGQLTEAIDNIMSAAAVMTEDANSRALVVAKQQVIKSRMDELGIKPRACGGSEKQHDTSSRDAGRFAGDRASFGRPVSGQAGVLRIGKPAA
jgi:hypothetical protein